MSLSDIKSLLFTWLSTVGIHLGDDIIFHMLPNHSYHHSEKMRGKDLFSTEIFNNRVHQQKFQLTQPAMALSLTIWFLMIHLSMSFVPLEKILLSNRIHLSRHFHRRSGSIARQENYHEVCGAKHALGKIEYRGKGSYLGMIPSNLSCKNVRLDLQMLNNINGHFRISHFHRSKIDLFSSHKTRLFSTSSQHWSQMWEPITSTKNPTVKLFKSLISKRRERKKKNATVIEGHRIVMDMLSNSNTLSSIQHVLVTEQALNHIELGEKLENLLLNLSPPQKINIVSDEVLQMCCDTMTPQGIVATCSIPKSFSTYDPSQDLIQEPKLFLVLDGVSDPGNVGTLLRSSAAVGVTAVILLPDCTDVWAPKAIRSGMGASFHVPIVSMESFEDCLDFLEKCGCKNQHFYAATMDVSTETSLIDNDTSSPAHYEIDWVTNALKDSIKVSALCIGKEGPGLSAEVREAVSVGKISSVHVPMEETGVVESLNAAVCGSVILFEFGRQKRVALNY